MISKGALPSVAEPTRTPSMSSSVWSESAPRMNTELCCPRPPALSMLMPARSASRSCTEDTWRASMSSRVSTVEEKNDWSSGSGMRAAVTISCCSSCGCWHPAARTQKKHHKTAPRRARRGLRPVDTVKLLDSTHPCPFESCQELAGLRLVAHTVRPASPAATSNGDARGRSPGSRAEALGLPGGRLPAPVFFTGAVARDPPDLDYRCGGSAGFGRIRTGLPVLPVPSRDGHLTPREACLQPWCAVQTIHRAAPRDITARREAARRRHPTRQARRRGRAGRLSGGGAAHRVSRLRGAALRLRRARARTTRRDCLGRGTARVRGCRALGTRARGTAAADGSAHRGVRRPRPGRGQRAPARRPARARPAHRRLRALLALRAPLARARAAARLPRAE